MAELLLLVVFDMYQDFPPISDVGILLAELL